MNKNLTDIEIAKIETFCADEAMFEAVKKVLIAELYSQGVTEKGKNIDPINGAFNLIAQAYSKGEKVSNEDLGERLRGLYEGVHIVVGGFAQLKTINSKKEEILSPFNGAI